MSRLGRLIAYSVFGCREAMSSALLRQLSHTPGRRAQPVRAEAQHWCYHDQIEDGEGRENQFEEHRGMFGRMMTGGLCVFIKSENTPKRRELVTGSLQRRVLPTRKLGIRDERRKV